jgi:sugar lactone lactonase YvrE
MGSSVLNPVGRIFYRAPDGRLTKVADGNLAHPDGIGLSPDGKTLYIDEWLGGRVIAMPIIEPGLVDTDQAYVLAYLGGAKPDGMATDEHGNIYIACWGAGGSVTVIGADGSYYGAITAPTGEKFQPTNVTFNKDYLYVTDAGGIIWRVKTKIAGAPSAAQ